MFVFVFIFVFFGVLLIQQLSVGRFHGWMFVQHVMTLTESPFGFANELISLIAPVVIYHSNPFVNHTQCIRFDKLLRSSVGITRRVCVVQYFSFHSTKYKQYLSSLSLRVRVWNTVRVSIRACDLTNQEYHQQHVIDHGYSFRHYINTMNFRLKQMLFIQLHTQTQPQLHSHAERQSL